MSDYMNDYISKTDALLAIGEEEPLVWNEDDEYEQGRHNQWVDDLAAIDAMKCIENSKVNPTLADVLTYIDNCDQTRWQDFVNSMWIRGWSFKWIGNNRWS